MRKQLKAELQNVAVLQDAARQQLAQTNVMEQEYKQRLEVQSESITKLTSELKQLEKINQEYKQRIEPLSAKLAVLEAELEQVRSENAALHEELDAFDPSFFEELEVGSH